MKPTILFVLLSISINAFGQYPSGKIVVERLYSKSLENPSGENPERRITIYLPPNYDESSTRYPVMYYLHGFTWSDSLQIARDNFNKLLDKAIDEGIMRPMIVVLPDHHTLYRGSFYTNSTFTGNWADFTAIDLVKYVDSKFRTISDRNSRGIAGHSMGGYGAIKLAMQYPDVFSITYGLSPGLLGFSHEFGPKSSNYKRIAKLKDREQVVTGYSELYPNALIAFARTVSPNPNNPPFFADLPYEYDKNGLKINYEVLALWHKHSPIHMVSSYVKNLKQLTAIKFDWGRNEENLFLPPTCHTFSRELELYGIKHFAEEYVGTHSNMLWTEDGRAMTDLFPFFNKYLEFE